MVIFYENLAESNALAFGADFKADFDAKLALLNKITGRLTCMLVATT
jgi:hypothetical protein